MSGPEKKTNNIKVAIYASTVAIGMVAMTYASIPLIFDAGDKIQNSKQATIVDRYITVEFDANVNRKLDWSFKPVQRKVTMKVGERRQVFYRAKNLSDKTITGTAVFNATPMFVGKFFSITDCFCFTSHTLQPGQSVDLPVRFSIDPAFDKSRDLKKLKTITLSYTFYRAKKDTVGMTGDLNKTTQLAQVQIPAQVLAKALN